MTIYGRNLHASSDATSSNDLPSGFEHLPEPPNIPTELPTPSSPGSSPASAQPLAEPSSPCSCPTALAPPVPPTDSTLALMLLRPFPTMAAMDSKFHGGGNMEKAKRVFIKTMHDRVLRPDG
ncbi:hypothetical protein MRB53_002882 [Persea americana]|uniref:Uncharacterized protein n=1 Tax=Persea americana TaxID=3435 RepID=A0ACC2MXH3_PERAE|nr:hypothetical protein MRB53_002882 [Persea americana]